MNWIWIFIRITGLTAYVLLTLSLLGGILRHVPKNKAFLQLFHQIIGQVALLFIGVHAYLLIFDHYEAYQLREILVPFLSSHDRLLSGFGTVATYLLIVVIITSDFMKKIGRAAWKKTHYLVFPLWLLAFLHSLFIGTESTTLWAQALYWISFSVVVISTLYLIVKMNSGKKQQKKASQMKNVVMK